MNSTRNSSAKTFCILHSAFCIAATAAYAAAPVIDASSITVAQRPDRTVEIDYTMTPAAVGDADTAIVTVDILTNAVSVGGEHLRTLTGDVNKRVAHTSDYKHKILWQPDEEGMGEFSLPAAQVKAEITVWTTNNPPAYWIIDLTHPKDRTADRYYPEVGQIPLGVTNVLYKTDRLVMRRIPAKGVTWRQGGAASGNAAYRYVTFSYDYWMGIYEITRKQYNYLRPSGWGATAINNNAGFPYTGQHFGTWRGESLDNWPGNKDTATSGLGWIAGARGNTGFSKFEVPTEAEWEFACRAGSSTKYSNGETAADLDKVAWTQDNSGGAYHEVGTKEPNAWGLYDMHGNALEWALTRFATRSTDPVWDPLGPSASEVHTSGSTPPKSWGNQVWQCRGGAAVNVSGKSGSYPCYSSTDLQRGNSGPGIRLCLPLP